MKKINPLFKVSVIVRHLLVTYFQAIVSIHNAPALVSGHHAGGMTRYLDAVQPASQEGHQGGKSRKESSGKNSKTSGVKTFPFIDDTQGKRGAQRCAKPAGRSPVLKPQQRQWHSSGQGKTHLQLAMEKGRGRHRYCAVLMVGEGTPS